MSGLYDARVHDLAICVYTTVFTRKNLLFMLSIYDAILSDMTQYYRVMRNMQENE